jgi:SAM-dependent methyltransferase
MLVREYFDATLPDWETIYAHPALYSTIYQERLRAALRCVDDLGLGPGSPAVDIGCGPGLGSAGLARRGFVVHAVDSSAKMVERTLTRARSEGVPMRGSVDDIHRLSLPDAAFDLAFVVGVSEWLETLERPLAEVARVLRPGGALVLTADNSWALSCLLDPLQNPLVVPLKRALGGALRRLSQRRPLRVHPRSRRILQAALRRAGMVPTVATTLGFGPFTLFNRSIIPDRIGHKIHRKLQALASKSWLGAAGLVHVMVARKLSQAFAPE